MVCQFALGSCVRNLRHVLQFYLLLLQPADKGYSVSTCFKQYFIQKPSIGTFYVHTSQGRLHTEVKYDV